jgi:hypothetical protein
MIPLCVGFAMVLIGNRFEPEKLVIGGYDTVRDLIDGMHSQTKP